MTKLCELDGRPCHPDCEQWSDCDQLDTDFLAIIAAQDRRIKGLELWIRSLKRTPHKWLRSEIKEVLGEEE